MQSIDSKSDPYARLTRELGVFGAVMMGLGAMVGTGVFVSIGVAAGATGASVILAVVLAAAVATCNALSSAQLAASHPVSGGTYEYGYRYLSPSLGFTAGWMFLCAKSASAATAALGFSGYLLSLLGWNTDALVWVALAGVVAFTLLVLAGIRRSSWANILIVSVTLAALIAFVATGLPDVLANGTRTLVPFFPAGGIEGTRGFLYATALMFVAFTGYGRIATMGEEVTDPRRNIPRAIVATIIVAAVLYTLVAVVAIGLAGAAQFAAAARDHATPLAAAARGLGQPWVASLVAVGAVTAMLGVLLNLILGLSRVALAMGRRGDLPDVFARLHGQDRTPSAAVVGVGIAVCALALTGSVETTWAFSAFTVLIYYALTNLAALRLPRAERLYPRAVAVSGLVACLSLAFWVPVRIWTAGLALIAVGLLWHAVATRSRARRSADTK